MPPIAGESIFNPSDMKNKKRSRKPEDTKKKNSAARWILPAGGLLLAAALLYAFGAHEVFRAKETASLSPHDEQRKDARHQPEEKWLQRAYAIGLRFYPVYSHGWEGANGAYGDAFLFAITNDSSLLRYHTIEKDMRRMFNGTWVDDRAWICLAELKWWEVTGKTRKELVDDARQRYDEARREGRLSNHEGFWSWYNWPPNARVNDRIFTNSNMNHMVSVACELYLATGERKYLDDALLVWEGDGTTPGVEKMFYRGKGVWKGKPGPAAFGKQLPWEGTEYCSVLRSLYRVTGNEKYKRIAIETAKRIMDPANGWVDPTDYYQIHMDGNGAFVTYLLDAYALAPNEMRDIFSKIEKMLEHVWTNHHGKARVTLHRTSDHAIRNGWNPEGGEDGYGVDDIGTSHAQSQALRAFAAFAYYKNRNRQE